MEKHQIWKTALSRLQERIDSPVFTTWISNTVALSFHKGIFVVGVQTTFAKAHLQMRYRDVIRTTLTEIVGTPLEIQLVVADDKLLAGEMFPIPIKPPFRETRSRKFLIVITQEESCHRASVPDVPKCVAVGKTREEAVHAVRDALHSYLAMMQKDHMALPEPRTTAEYLLFPPSFQEEGSTHMGKDTLSLGVSVSRCSFCDKPEDQIASLTAGPGGFSICNECVDYCREMIEQGPIDFQQLKQSLASRK
jgi:predicted RNase H-like HicB family nuclease